MIIGSGNKIQAMLERMINPAGDAPIHSAVAQLSSLGGEVVFSGAAGIARPDSDKAMTPESPIHIASVTKTMTAVALHQLVEAGATGPGMWDTRLAELDVVPAEVLSRLHRTGGRSAAEQITLRHLLTHTSGMRDAMEDSTEQLGGPAPGSIIGELLMTGGVPSRTWVGWDPTRVEEAYAGVLNFYLARGLGEKPLFAPGEGFHYSDTGYVMLALVIEKLAGEPLQSVFAERIFRPLGMAHSYLAYRNDPAIGPFRSPEAEIWAGAMPVLCSGVSLSFDWGGGGVVSTVADLAKFLAAVIDGRLFQHSATRDAMLDWCIPNDLQLPRTGVGMGLFRTKYPGLELWGHSGAWGTKMVFDPESRLLLTGSVNQAGAPADWHVRLLLAAREGRL